MVVEMRDRQSRTAPDWVPPSALTYLAHTEGGLSLRALAKHAGVHASTVMRQVRKIELKRDDTLVDLALDRLRSQERARGGTASQGEKAPPMTAALKSAPALPTDDDVDREARRILRRLSEPRACLAVARDMEMAVVVREAGDGESVRTAVVERAVAEAMALKDWIACDAPGRVSRYRITPAGSAALKRLIAEAGDRFGDQHRDMEDRHVSTGDGGRRRVRYNAAESPVLALSRRRDKDGQPFLLPRLVSAGERLREDFELAQMGPRITQNWERFLSGGDRPASAGDGGLAEGPAAARARVHAAMTALGPGLADVALRCCCFLEGLEATEKRMGWSARSGKIVLRIALQGLARHYDETEGGWSPLIG